MTHRVLDRGARGATMGDKPAVLTTCRMSKSVVRSAFLLQLLTVVAFGVATLPGRAQSAPEGTSKIETVAILPSADTENLCGTSDGSIYVTGLDDKVLWKVSPAGHVEKFFEWPSVAALIGVAATSNGVAVGAFERPFRRPAPAGGGRPPAPTAAPGTAQAGGPDFSDVGSEILVLDKTGKLTATIRGQKGQAFNGITPAGDGKYLVADSNASTLWQVDPARKRIEPWLKGDALAPAGPVSVGANGIKVHDGWVYVSVTSRSAIYRVQIGADGRPRGSLTVFAQGLRLDDFDVAKDGTMYAPSGNTLYKISPKGEVSKFLENVSGGPAALVSRDGKWLYWITRGGSGPQRLLRVAIG